MAKRNVFLHLGPAFEDATTVHGHLRADPVLAAAAVSVPAVDAETLHLADLELRRTHKAAGLRRKDVEGAWARVCRKAVRSRSDVLISQPGWLDLTPEQASLAADSLDDLRLHLVLTPPTEPIDAQSYAGGWARLVGRKGGIHVLPVGRGLTVEDFAQAVALLALEIDRERVERRMASSRRRRDRYRRLTRQRAA